MKLPRALGGRGVPSGDEIAADALRYKGHPYVYGVWDCSGFAAHVLGQDLGLTLPGGVRGFRGPVPGNHGPVVLDYVNWAGAAPVSSPARGDLVLWPGAGPNGHMGFVLGPNQMISALDPADGTKVTPIQGFGPPGITPVYRRIVGSAAGTPGGGGASAQTGGQPAGTGVAQPVIALLTVAAMAGGVLLAAALAGTLVAVTGMWLISKGRADA